MRQPRAIIGWPPKLDGDAGSLAGGAYSMMAACETDGYPLGVGFDFVDAAWVSGGELLVDQWVFGPLLLA